jgi:hypothetical protein
MQTQDTPPAGLETFDVDKHLPQVNAYVAAHEQSFFRTHAMVGSRVSKADGLRMSFDIVRVHSLIRPELDSTYISLSMTMLGMHIPGGDSQAIAGVLGDALWFSSGGRYFAASEMIKLHEEVMAKAASKLRPILTLLELFIQHDSHDEGEAWKQGEIPQELRDSIDRLIREAGLDPADDD